MSEVQLSNKWNLIGILISWADFSFEKGNYLIYNRTLIWSTIIFLFYLEKIYFKIAFYNLDSIIK